MSNISPLRTEEDYQRALKEIEPYFEDPPERGTTAGDRFELLAAQIKEYEEVNFPDATAEAAIVCAELYQVIGYLAEELGVLSHPDVQRALDNASAHKLVHRDLLPWPKQPLRSARPLDP